MLFWYTPQIVYFQYSALRVLEEQGKILERSESRIRRLEAELAEQRAQNQDLRQAWEDFERTMAAPASSFQAGERGDADARAAKSREG
jgi:septal ring factor EnvC (AmiA/AmiB activator)